MSKSIIQGDSRYCIVTGRTDCLDKHHLVPGTANRRKAEEDGLWVYMFHPIHMTLHNNPEMERAYIRMAQRAYEKKHTREQWMNRYHKNYLGDEEDG
jgi:hypothetical protein